MLDLPVNKRRIRTPPESGRKKMIFYQPVNCLVGLPKRSSTRRHPSLISPPPNFLVAGRRDGDGGVYIARVKRGRLRRWHGAGPGSGSAAGGAGRCAASYKLAVGRGDGKDRHAASSEK